MNGTTGLVLLVVGGAAIVRALLGAVARRLSERFAVWTLPDEQTVTFRIAWVIVRVAGWAAPQNTFGWPRPRVWVTGEWVVQEFPRRSALWPFWYYNMRRFALEWTAPAEALADLEEDLAAEHRVLHPVRLVFPLLGEAIRFRLANYKVLVMRALAPVVGLMALLVVPISCGLASLALVSLFPLMAWDRWFNASRRNQQAARLMRRRFETSVLMDLTYPWT